MTQLKQSILHYTVIVLFSGVQFISANCNNTGSSFISDERRLTQCLLDNYDTSVRPARTYKDTIQVSLDMTLMHIVSLDEKTKILDVNGWLHKEWIDPQLTWNPDDYGGVQVLRIPSERIWIPDIILLNNADTKSSYVMDKLTVVAHTGRVVWVPHARFKTFCPINMARFPFDTQQCSLLFGSWTYDITKLNINVPKNTSLKYLYDGKEWDITRYDVKRDVFKYYKDVSDDKSVEQYPYILYTLKMKRTSVFYGTLFVAPVVLLAALTIFIFFVPPESNERISLGIGIIIALSLNVVVIENYIPTEIAEMPTLLSYVLFNFVMVTFAILISMAVLNFHHRGSRRGKVPAWMRSLFLGKLRKLFCLEKELYTPLNTDVAFTEASADVRFEGSATELETSMPLPKSPTLAMETVLQDIRRYLKQIANNNNNHGNQRVPVSNEMSHKELVKSEWHQVAVVIDRLMFWLFTVVTILVTIITLSHS